MALTFPWLLLTFTSLLLFATAHRAYVGFQLALRVFPYFFTDPEMFVFLFATLYLMHASLEDRASSPLSQSFLFSFFF